MYLGPYQRPAQLHSTAFCHSSAVSPGQFNEGPVCSGRDWNNCCFTQCSNDVLYAPPSWDPAQHHIKGLMREQRGGGLRAADSAHG